MMDHILKCHDIVKTDFVRAENCSLFDTQGRRYFDFESGIWCTALGHGHPYINKVITDQLSQVAHIGTRYPNAVAEGCALAVLEIVGILNGKCVFLSSGSEAVEFAVQTARRVTGRKRMLTFANSYLAAYGSAGSKSENDWHLVDWGSQTEKELHAILSEITFEQIGGFVLEPGGSGSGFVKFPPKSLVEDICHRVKQAGGLLVVNEITTGMGRTGKWFGFQHYDVQPDIVSLGKGLGNGYPISAVAMQREVAETMEASGFRYAQSHQNDPLGCAVARGVITVMREEGWIEKGAAKGEYLLQGLKRLAEKYAIVKEARGRGMLLGLELYPHESFTAETAYYKLLEKGFLVGYYPAGNILRFDPALTIEREHIDGLLSSLDEILEPVHIV